MMGPGDYVQRSVNNAADPFVVVAVVDRHGHITHVMLPKKHTSDGNDIDTLRAAVQRASIPRTPI